MGMKLLPGVARFVLVLLVVLLAACSPQVSVPPTPTETIVAPGSTEVPTAAPTETPLPGKVLLWTPAGSTQESIRNVLSQLSADAGLVLEALPDVGQANLTQDVRVVVLQEPPQNLNELVAGAPQVQFIVISSAELPYASNLTVITDRPENKAFLAGFISTLLSPDWRAAGLLPADGPLGPALQDAFVNGGRYFCGVCAPGWPLGSRYPQVAALPGASAGVEWQSAAAGLFDSQAIDVYYLSPDAVKPEVITYMQDRLQYGRTVLLVGAETPPAELRAQWAATIRSDAAAAIRRVWPQVLAGQGGTVHEAALALEDVDETNMGGGRRRLVDELLAEIEAGRIYPFTVPVE